MTNREKIEALRGKYEQRIMCEVSTPSGVLALVAFGYENYPEPSRFAVSLDGVLLRSPSSVLYTDCSDADVIEKVVKAFPHLDLSLSILSLAVGELEYLPW
jgi:hypothetical protein